MGTEETFVNSELLVNKMSDYFIKVGSLILLLKLDYLESKKPPFGAKSVTLPGSYGNLLVESVVLLLC